MSPHASAIRVRGLRKTYRGATRPALDGFDLTVSAGTVHGLLGPNGAGKTTAVRILATLQRHDSGTAEVAGIDVAERPREVRTKIGLVGQYAAVDEILSGRQNLVMFGRLFHLSTAVATHRADELLTAFDLTEAAGTPIRRYSGGMRRRLDLAASMILAPRVLFLDEPTTGLDPRGRNEVWSAVRQLVSDGTTVLLTTQYLDEADQLADHISVLDAGRVVAGGTPTELKRRVGGDHLDVIVRTENDLTDAAAIIARTTGFEPETSRDVRQISVPVRDRVPALTETVRALVDGGIEVEDISLRRPTLDDVFLRVTGHRAATGDNPASDAHAPRENSTA